ncbi:MAG: hypothetical protein ABL998_06695 [Planctomycetota bacterium]
MKLTAHLLGLALLLLPIAPFAAARQDEANQEAREEAFAALLTNARLTGIFTDDARPDAVPQRDSYTISKAECLEDGIWRIESLIEYGKNSVKVPLFIKIKWAGDTPVMTLDDLEVPGLGKFTCRILFHGKSYAGIWRGADHGGAMSGVIEHPATTDAK